MRLSQLFTKTLKEAPADETSINAQLLIRAGFVSKVMAGVYEYLPLGLRVLNKINNIIREEMNAVGGQEVLMSVLQNKETWIPTGRWEQAKEVMYQFKDSGGREYGLGFTHEEPLAVVAKHFISSYKDLPKAVYQIQTKFRNELRAKSGLLRGREFLMKDLYSFHATQADLDDYYEKVASAYLKIFKRLGVKAIRTFASGGLFSKYSDEFQAVSDAGEDIIYINEKENRALNKEILNDEVLADLKWKKSELMEKPAIEVGNIFKLGTKFSEPLGLMYTDKTGGKNPVLMASYGMGPSRLMGAVAEIYHDEKGIIWPEEIAPFDIIIVELNSKNGGADNKVHKIAEALYQDLQQKGVDVLYDDRTDKSAGEKFAEADLLGIPLRVVISEKTAEQEKVETKKRGEEKITLLNADELIKKYAK